MKKTLIACLFSLCGFMSNHSQAQKLTEGFSVSAADIGAPAADGVGGTITNTGGSNYRVRSMNGAWWMIQNADKPLAKADGSTFNSINRGTYGHLYTWNGAAQACPDGWILPKDDSFKSLSKWLTANNKWHEWNSGFALGGYGVFGRYGGKQDVYARWWSGSNNRRRWGVEGSNTSGDFFTDCIFDAFGVRCMKIQ